MHNIEANLHFAGKEEQLDWLRSRQWVQRAAMKGHRSRRSGDESYLLLSSLLIPYLQNISVAQKFLYSLNSFSLFLSYAVQSEPTTSSRHWLTYSSQLFIKSISRVLSYSWKSSFSFDFFGIISMTSIVFHKFIIKDGIWHWRTPTTLQGPPQWTLVWK